jgi:hypothetical protein
MVWVGKLLSLREIGAYSLRAALLLMLEWLAALKLQTQMKV